MSEWNFENDRRRNFRITEKAVVRYRLVEDCQQSLEALFPPSKELRLLSDLRQLDEEAEPLLRRINDEEKAIAGYLRMLNRKIDRIAQSLSQSDNDRHYNKVTLSEGGLSLLSKKPIAEGSILAVRLQLLPEGCGILSYLKVVYSLDLNNNHYRIGGEFIDLEDKDRHLIARHLMEAQARLRRQNRQQEQSS